MAWLQQVGSVGHFLRFEREETRAKLNAASSCWLSSLESPNATRRWEAAQYYVLVLYTYR